MRSAFAYVLATTIAAAWADDGSKNGAPSSSEQSVHNEEKHDCTEALITAQKEASRAMMEVSGLEAALSACESSKSAEVSGLRQKILSLEARLATLIASESALQAQIAETNARNLNMVGRSWGYGDNVVCLNASVAASQALESTRTVEGYVAVLVRDVTLAGSSAVDVAWLWILSRAQEARFTLSRAATAAMEASEPQLRQALEAVVTMAEQARAGMRRLVVEYMGAEYLARLDGLTTGAFAALERARGLAAHGVELAATYGDKAVAAARASKPKVEVFSSAVSDLSSRLLASALLKFSDLWQATKKRLPSSCDVACIIAFLGMSRDSISEHITFGNDRVATAILAGLITSAVVVAMLLVVAATKLTLRLGFAALRALIELAFVAVRKFIKMFFAILAFLFVRAAPYSIRYTAHLFVLIIVLPFRFLLLPVTAPLKYFKKETRARPVKSKQHARSTRRSKK